MLSSAEITRFYTSHLCEIPGRPQFRQFKFRTGKNYWVRSKRKIRNQAQLRQKLLKELPQDAYVSVSEWLSPERLEGYAPKGAGYKHLSKTLISSDFFVEFDETNPEVAHQQFLAAYDVLRRKYDVFKFLRSHRGDHIWVLDWYGKACKKKIAGVRDRIDYVKQKKIKTAQELLDAGIKFDTPQSLSVFSNSKTVGKPTP